MKADPVTGTMVKYRILQTTPKVLRWKGKKKGSRKGKKEQRRTVWLYGTLKRTLGKSERFRGNREEIV